VNELALDRRTAELMATIDAGRYVGSKHHVVPRFILERFSNARKQVVRRDRQTGVARTCHVKDLAITDFYTFIDQTGQLDASFEQLWGVLEQAAAAVLREHVSNPFVRPRPFTLDEKHAIDGLVALQFVRGPAPRRAGELIADYSVKLVNQDKLSPAEMREFEIIPHQNHHLEVMTSLVEKVEQELATRATCLVELSKPLLVISDEPVCLERPDDFAVPTRKQLRDYSAPIMVDGEPVSREDIIQIQG